MPIEKEKQVDNLMLIEPFIKKKRLEITLYRIGIDCSLKVEMHCNYLDFMIL